MQIRKMTSSGRVEQVVYTAVLVLAVGAATANAGQKNVPVCHRPPDNPDNYRTLMVSPAALPSHLAEGDIAGTCESACVTGALCDDQNLCTNDNGSWDNSTQHCLCRHESISCSDDNPCTDDFCDPSAPGGCKHVPNDTRTCDDGNSCTESDHCSAGNCVGEPVKCDDANPCTKDSCDPERGCVSVNDDSLTCDDGNLCTLAHCSAGVCIKTAVSCDDHNVCTDDSCDPSIGCVYNNNQNSCDDGKACTMGDRCQGGVCAGTQYSCPAPSQCQTGVGTCKGDGSCSYVDKPDGTACNDGNSCTNSDACHAGVCSGISVTNGTVCDDGNPCTGCPAGFTSVADGCEKIYQIGADQLDNQNDFCDGTGVNRLNFSCQGDYGFHWSDEGAGLGPVLRVGIDFQSGIGCGDYFYPMLFNGVEVGTLYSWGDCGCTQPITPESLPSLSGDNYLQGDVNKFAITQVQSCGGLSSGGNLGAGVFARVKVAYSYQPDQCVGGTCVPGKAADTCPTPGP